MRNTGKILTKRKISFIQITWKYIFFWSRSIVLFLALSPTCRLDPPWDAGNFRTRYTPHNTIVFSFTHQGVGVNFTWYRWWGAPKSHWLMRPGRVVCIRSRFFFFFILSYFFYISLFREIPIYGSVQDCGTSSASAMELPQSCAKSSICNMWRPHIRIILCLVISFFHVSIVTRSDLPFPIGGITTNSHITVNRKLLLCTFIAF